MQPVSASAICHIDDKIIEEIRLQMGPEENLLDLAELFKVLGDHTRVRILQALAASELAVCCLADLLHLSSSAVSHQLRILRAAKIVKYRKEGKNVYYSLDDQHVEHLIKEGIEHVLHG